MSTEIDNEDRGYIYVLSNRSMPGIFKVGFTRDDIEKRAVELQTTGVPEPFQVEYVVNCQQPAAIEATTHRALGKFRISSKREFFRVSLLTVVETISKNIKQTDLVLQTPFPFLSFAKEVNPMEQFDELQSGSAANPKSAGRLLCKYCGWELKGPFLGHGSLCRMCNQLNTFAD